MKKIHLHFLFFILTFAAHSQTKINESLYINSGDFITSTDTTFPCLSINTSAVFNQMNSILNIEINDTLILKYINNDSIDHQFTIKEYNYTSGIIPLGDSIIDTIVCTNVGLFSLFDLSDYPNNLYLGLGTMLLVKPMNTNPTRFYWNIKDHNLEWNYLIKSGATVNWNNYKPDYFTLNGNGKNDIENDSSAIITGNVGDTIHINIVNTGRSIHSLHFHGYHVKVLKSDLQPEKINWIKDTYPLIPEEVVIFELIPDKKGKYPVHNHNLIGATGGGIYPNGIFLVMDINP